MKLAHFNCSSLRNVAFALLTVLAATAGQADESNQPKTTSMNQTQTVVALLKSIETGDPKPVAAINPHQYLQHNLDAGDGVAGFGALLQAIPKGSARTNTVRAFSDGAYVVAHTEYNFFGPKIGFDIFRFENGLIVEHWDNLQEKPSTPNPSGHTMTDGPTEPIDLSHTEENKRLVRAFVDDILVKGKLDQLQGYFDGDAYIQHNPQIADGLSGLSHALAAMVKAGITMKYEKIHLVIGSGNLVLTASEGSLGGKPVAFYDLFRVANGKIAEHWDTIQSIPARSEWKNSNGKF